MNTEYVVLSPFPANYKESKLIKNFQFKIISCSMQNIEKGKKKAILMLSSS
jgi:hypothetical protein